MNRVEERGGWGKGVGDSGGVGWKGGACQGRGVGAYGGSGGTGWRRGVGKRQA